MKNQLSEDYKVSFHENGILIFHISHFHYTKLGFLGNGVECKQNRCYGVIGQMEYSEVDDYDVFNVFYCHACGGG